MENWVNYAPYFGVAGAIFAFILFRYVKSFSSGNETMIELEDMIHDGAMAFLKREYSILVIFIAAVFALLWFGINWQTAVAFVTGACLLRCGRFFRHDRRHPGQLPYGSGRQ